MRDLLAIPDPEDAEAQRKVGDLIADTISAKKTMPEVDTVRQMVRAAAPVLDDPLLEECLPEWLRTKKNLKRNTYRSYESHIRLCLIPYLGKVRRSKLRVAHVADMFDQIAEHNEEMRAARASDDPQGREAVKYQRPVGPSSMQRIRETLRSALNDFISREFGDHVQRGQVGGDAPGRAPQAPSVDARAGGVLAADRHVPRTGDGLDTGVHRPVLRPH